jgi:hypothetical protein
VRTVEALRAAVGTDLAAIGPLLAADVQWYGPHRGGGCRSRDDVLRTLRVWIVLTPDGDGLAREIQQYLSVEAALHDDRVRADGAPAGPPVSGLVPFVHVTDVDRSVAFYELLGFAVNDSFEHQGERVWVWLESEDARLMLARGDAPGMAEAVLFYVYSRDLAALRDHLVANGVTPGRSSTARPARARRCA